jgi:curved DNA-binding protein CbpA
MEELRFYRTLGLPAGANLYQIKSAYRLLAKRYHPDVTRNPDSGEQFLRISRAYKNLVAREQKSNYLRSTLRRSPAPAAPKAQAEQNGDSLYAVGKTLVEGKTPEMRAFAARRLGLSGKKGSYIYLKRAFGDSSETVVLAVLDAVGRLQVRSSVKDLAEVFDRGSRAVKMGVLEALERMAIPRGSIDILTWGMQSSDRALRLKSLSLFAEISKEKAG